jgi:hypothetical protein
MSDMTWKKFRALEARVPLLAQSSEAAMLRKRIAELENLNRLIKEDECRCIEQREAAYQRIAQLEAENDRLEFQLGEMIGKFSDLEAEFDALRAATQWQPIEQAPRVDGESILLRKKYTGEWLKGSWSDSQQDWIEHENYWPISNISHYHPAPPKEAE